MHVLFDKNVPYGLKRFLKHHLVETVDDRGWGRIKNGDLLHVAEQSGFDVVLTADQNIVYQQNLKHRKIALVVVGGNLWPIVRNHARTIVAAIDRSSVGGYAFIEMPSPRKPSS
ncbi:MAG: hypothetical protein HY820_32265 [Acidobacteria bacterium]|nr:hypothetical protein [Acidobacteriota bacterium]